MKGKPKRLYCFFVEGVSLFTSYLFLSLFNEGDYFEKPGIMDDYRNSPTIKFCADIFPFHRCEKPLYKAFLKQSIALNAVLVFKK